MNETIKRIADNWKLDARFEDNNKYFFNYQEVEQILNDDKCYVIGRKGSGKTAICEHILKASDYNMSIGMCIDITRHRGLRSGRI